MGNLSRLALAVTIAADAVLAAVIHKDLGIAQVCPGARRWVAGADQVIDHVHMVGPVDLGFGGLKPALVSGLRLVLLCGRVAAGHHRICCFQKRGHAHGKQLVEIQLAQGLVRPDVAGFLQNHQTLVQAVAGAEDGQAGLLFTARHRPVDRRGSAVFGQQGRVVLDGAVLRNIEQRLRRKLHHVGHDADVRLQALHRVVRGLVGEFVELQHVEAARLRFDP